MHFRTPSYLNKECVEKLLLMGGGGGHRDDGDDDDRDGGVRLTK
jgi:hypothetical protein